MTPLANRGRSLRSRDSRRRKRARRTSFDVLEGRITPTTFLVVNALDGPGAGPRGSLRQAITQAEQSGDPNAVVAISPRVHGTIALNSGELVVDASLSVINRSGGPIEIRQTTSGDRVFHVTSAPQTASFQIVGASARETITVDGGHVATGNGGAILVDNPANVLTLKNVDLVDNSAGLASSSSLAQNGGAVYSSGHVVLVNSKVGTASNPNQTSGDGGGLWAGAGMSMTSSAVNGNLAGSVGGGVFVSGGDSTISRSRVDGNRALDVGGISELKGNLRVVDGSEVDGNSSTAVLDVAAGNFGGGGISEGVGDVYVSKSQVSENHSVGMYSSGIVVALGSVTVTSGSRIDGNVNNGPGGGIAANFGGIVTVSGHSQVDGNTGSGNGGGIVNFAGPHGGVRILGGSEVSHNTLTNYESLGQAVGVFLETLANSLGLDLTTATGGPNAAEVTADIARIEQAVAATSPTGMIPSSPTGFVVSGGGIGTLLGASISVSGGSHVDDNLSGAQVASGNHLSIGIGGGLFSGLGSITLSGSTVSGNTALGGGGGIWNEGSLTSSGSTIADNTAVQAPGGGLYNAPGATASIDRGVVQGNRASLGAGANNQGTLSLVNSQVIKNQASVRGGGLLNGGQQNLVHTSVVANTPDNTASSV